MIRPPEDQRAWRGDAIVVTSPNPAAPSSPATEQHAAVSPTAAFIYIATWMIVALPTDSTDHALIGRCVADRFGGSAISAGDFGILPTAPRHATSDAPSSPRSPHSWPTIPTAGRSVVPAYDPTPPTVPTTGSTPVHPTWRAARTRYGAPRGRAGRADTLSSVDGRTVGAIVANHSVANSPTVLSIGLQVVTALHCSGQLIARRLRLTLGPKPGMPTALAGASCRVAVLDHDVPAVVLLHDRPAHQAELSSRESQGGKGRTTTQPGKWRTCSTVIPARQQLRRRQCCAQVGYVIRFVRVEFHRSSGKHRVDTDARW